MGIQMRPAIRSCMRGAEDIKNDLEAALRKCEEFLEKYPAHRFASEQRLRIKAKKLEPDALIGEVDTMAELGEEVGEALLPEYVERLFATGQSLRAREEVTKRMGRLHTKLGVRLAWVCYDGRDYDLACRLRNYVIGLPSQGEP